MMNMKRLMDGLRKSISIALFSAAVLSPRVSTAMEIQQFDRMAAEDQQHYVAFLVKEAEQLLIANGHRDLAAQLHRLFYEIPSGEHRSVGAIQFEKHLASARAFSAEVNLPGKTSWNQMEWVLFETLWKNGIRPPVRFYQTYPQIIRNRVFYQKPK